MILLLHVAPSISVSLVYPPSALSSVHMSLVSPHHTPVSVQSSLRDLFGNPRHSRCPSEVFVPDLVTACHSAHPPSHLHQGSTLAMCPLARMHFLGRRATTIHFMLARGASGFQIGGKRWYQFFLLTYRVSPCDGLTDKYFHPQKRHRVILYVRTSIKMWLTNSIRHVTKLLMPKLNN